jgi:hypothetical protein
VAATSRAVAYATQSEMMETIYLGTVWSARSAACQLRGQGFTGSDRGEQRRRGHRPARALLPVPPPVRRDALAGIVIQV